MSVLAQNDHEKGAIFMPDTNDARRKSTKRKPQKVIANDLFTARNRLVKYGLTVNEDGDFCKDGKPITRAAIEQIIAATL